MNGGGNVPKAKINSTAINELYQTLNRLGADAEGISKQGIYEGRRIDCGRCAGEY